MNRPSIVVVVIALLDLVAAVTSLLLVDEIGLIASVLQFVLYVAMGSGLLALRKWARIVAIAVGILELAGLFAAMAFILFVSSRLATAATAPNPEFLGLLSALIVVNVVVVSALFLPKVKVQFR